MRAVGLGAVLAAVLGLAGCASTPPAGLQAGLQTAAEDAVRVSTPLTRGWRFHLGQPGSGDPAQPDFDDRAWQRVDVPHTWNALGEYRLGRTAATRNVQGTGWYRREFDASSLPARSRHWLQFDAVGNVADVWVNGVHVGRHAGAFSRFRFDITRALQPGRNVVAVRADNSPREVGSTTADVIPLLGDFFIHGGMYRGVSVVSVGEAHIALDDYGGPGLYATTAALSDEAARIDALVRLTHSGASAEAALIWLTLHDAQGAMVAEANTPLQLQPGRNEARLTLQLASPRRWDGRRDPYRYRLAARLVQGGTVVDQVEQQVGLRSFHVDPARGFFLNGRHLPLRGVSRHQDRLGRGWALTAADHAQDMALIEEMGANSVRFAHYQHAPEWFELNDARGMVAWAELALVNKVALVDAPATPALVGNARTQLLEQIRQHYNSPSVVTWGIGNEVDIDMVFGRLGAKADARPLLRELHALARQEDPSRPTVIADCCEDTPGNKAVQPPPLAGIADLMGYNRYFGWYYGQPADLGAHLDALHARHPRLPISLSEYGAGAALTQHSDDPAGGPIAFSGRPHPEDFQARYHELHWPQVDARNYLWGSWIWNMFDFSSAVRQEGDATDINDKGLVSFDRKVRKDAFFYFKAQWSEQPVVHVTGRRYVQRAYPVTDVRVYSNVKGELTLRVNGREHGRRRCEAGICVFPHVALAAGPNTVEAGAAFDGRQLTDAVEWNAPDPRDGIAINVGDLAQLQLDGRRFGSDAFFQGGQAARVPDAQAQAFAAHPRAPLLHGYRSGRFDYRLPLPPGRWRIGVTSMAIAPNAPRTPFEMRTGGGQSTRITPGRFGMPVEKAIEVSSAGDDVVLGFGADAVVFAITAEPLAGQLSGVAW